MELAKPLFRATETPAFACRTSRMRRSAKRAATAKVPSVDPSSTITSDQSRCVCASTDATASPIQQSRVERGNDDTDMHRGETARPLTRKP